MISAFGVEHGEISKGLPSALRAGGFRPGIGTQAIRQNNRIAAHLEGRKAAKYLSGSKNPQQAMQNARWGSTNEIARNSVSAGKTQKGYFKQGLSGPGGRRLNKPNGFGLE